MQNAFENRFGHYSDVEWLSARFGIGPTLLDLVLWWSL